jgi:hypothetical protein
MWHLGTYVLTRFWWTDQLKDPGVDGKIILKWILKKLNGMTCTGFVWLRIGTVGGLL